MAPDGSGGRRVPTLAEALAHHTAGRLVEAEAGYRSILSVDPGSEPAALNLAALLHATGRPGAEAMLRGLTERSPGNADAWCNLGVVVKAAGRAVEAEAAWRRALELAPLHADAAFNLGRHLSSTRRSAEALPMLERAAFARPGDGHRWSALATAKLNEGECWSGLDDLERALRRCPGDAELWSNHGSALQAVGRFEDSVASFDRALELAPGNGDIRYNRALTLLTLGRAGAWAEHEHRWSAPGFTSPSRGFAAPLWDGSAMPGATLLLHAEQGIGDTIQFARFVDPARERFVGRVVLEVQPPLVALLAPNLPGIEVQAQGGGLPPFDRHAPLLSLPAILGAEVGRQPPYLCVPTERGASVSGELGPRRGLRVGFVWAGNPAHGNDRNRSIAFGQMLPLLTLPGVEPVSLQKGERSEDPARHGATMFDAGRLFRDLADTAALLDALDLLVTVDTAVGHLAGALGISTRMLIPFRPDWRWGVQGTATPWYPSLRLLRQDRPGDWSGPIRMVETELADWLRGPDDRAD